MRIEAVKCLMLCTFSCLCPGDTGAFCVHRSVDLRILLPLFDLGDHVIKYYAECWLMFDSTTPNPVTWGTNRKAISKCKSLIRLLVKQAALLKVKTALSDWGPFGRFWTASLLSWLLRFSIAMALPWVLSEGGCRAINRGAAGSCWTVHM